MSSKQRRYALKDREAKQILSDASQRFKMGLDVLFGNKKIIEVIEQDGGQIYTVNARPVMFREENFLPLLCFTEFIDTAPKITVDMGAIPFVCKGANVMAPGVRCVEGEFSKGDLVVVVDERHGKTLALGESMFDVAIFKVAQKGPVIKTLHYVGDKYWNIAKLLFE
ncbi:MAG: DUF1947 domain-containing protein [Nitrososphaerota archaeon]|jgi:PUA domain protein|nr:DUF1947 domain-containing protein [Nitrososphaerota archaeon]